MKWGEKMKYYKVNKKGDMVNIYKFRDSIKGLILTRTLIANELYTENELKRLLCGATLSGIGNNEKIFELVNIPKNKTFFNFGCRFECK